MTKPDTCRVEIEEIEGVTVLLIRGKLTVNTSNLDEAVETVKRLIEVGHRTFVIDVHDVRKADFEGFADLVAAATIVANAGGSVALSRLSPAVEAQGAGLIMYPGLSIGGGPFGSVKEAVDALKV